MQPIISGAPAILRARPTTDAHGVFKPNIWQVLGGARIGRSNTALSGPSAIAKTVLAFNPKVRDQFLSTNIALPGQADTVPGSHSLLAKIALTWRKARQPKDLTPEEFARLSHKAFRRADYRHRVHQNVTPLHSIAAGGRPVILKLPQ